MLQGRCVPRIMAVALALQAPARAEPPRVVEVTPADGSDAVDPAVREIRVVFDRPMRPDGYSLVGGGPSFPRLIGKPRWVDPKTFAWAVRLEPGRDYELSVNGRRFRDFRAEDGGPAEPHPVRFRTASTPIRRTTADLNREALDALRLAFETDYANRDHPGIDWEAAFRDAEPSLVAATTPTAFALRLAAVLAQARDTHLWLRFDGHLLPTCRPDLRPNLDPAALRSAIPGLKPLSAGVSAGSTSDGILYIRIDTWDRDRAAELEPAFAALAAADQARGVVLDLRANTGGNEALARDLAGCFLAEPRPYARHSTRIGGVFAPEVERVAGPTPDRPAYRGKVAVLMGPATYSSGELFLLMMRQVPGCTLVGARSFGSASNPQPVDLGNGVSAVVPCWRSMTLDGTDIEGRGVDPDLAVAAGPADFAAGRDPVLEAALALLREP